MKRKTLYYLSLGIFALFSLLIYLNASKINNKIDSEGIYIKGVIVKTYYGAKSSPSLTANFNYNGINYTSNLSITDSKAFKKIKLTDSVLIKFIAKYPKLNRSEKLLKN
ncbi:hypothetical protein [uncultured Winogradskyella sp.]|uniref:hypothetical protein n=1 Tax=Winogradskyella sp. 4-2091 TaxID=3381659 RepID=UPI002622D000|nr:hypothetical protein [uncultured Winogradskyella sp.]